MTPSFCCAGQGHAGTPVVEFGIVQGPMRKFLYASYAGEVRCGCSARALARELGVALLCGLRIEEFYCSCATKIVLRQIRPE